MFWLLVFINIVFSHCNDTKAFMEEWDKHMKGFVADDQISFTVEGNSEEVH